VKKEAVDMMRVAALALLALGLFEAVAWVFDPLGVHTALNDGAVMSMQSRLSSAAFNALPLWIVAVAVQSKIRLGIAAGFPFLTFFFSMQVGGREKGWITGKR
jgi:hypothetical protein